MYDAIREVMSAISPNFTDAMKSHWVYILSAALAYVSAFVLVNGDSVWLSLRQGHTKYERLLDHAESVLATALLLCATCCELVSRWIGSQEFSTRLAVLAGEAAISLALSLALLYTVHNWLHGARLLGATVSEDDLRLACRMKRRIGLFNVGVVCFTVIEFRAAT